MDIVTVTRVQIMDEAVCISDSADKFGKGINPSILLPAIVRYKGRLISELYSDNRSWRRKILNTNLINST